MFQAERAVNEARFQRFQAEAPAPTASEETRQRAAEAEEARKRTAANEEQTKKDAQAAQQARKAREAAEEQAKKDAQTAQKQVRRAQDVTDKGKMKATAAQGAANASKKVAEEVQTANAAKEEAERKLTEGIQPVVTPTPEEVSAAKRRVQYREDLFHFAVAGVAGGGKSSLINAFRGLRNKDAGSAATGVTETTLAMARYASPNAEYPHVWYDIPGAGTLKIPDWQYFNAQGLYVFDCIIVVFDNRFTMTDIAILTNCRRFKIPTYIVRSKADQHISRIMKDMEYDSDDDESMEKKKKLYQTARQQFIQQTRQSVKDSLKNANIPDQRVYIVSYGPMLGVVKARRPMHVIDEIELLNDLIGEAQARRARPAEEKLMKANVARDEAEGKLTKGIQPLVTPTPEEVCTIKLLAEYREDLFHIAVAGIAGGGKSSLINAFRGLHNKDINIGAAATGVTETTTAIARCPDPNVEYPYVWYDVPGAGTLKIPDWQYFNAQGLYIYDCIIVLIDNRFTMTDIAILTNCNRFKIPAYIVRSKADQHIRNLMEDKGYDAGDDQDGKLYYTARQQFIQETRQSVKDNLKNANMPDQRVYIVSNKTMLRVVKDEEPENVIDEIDLLNDFFWEAQSRRIGYREALVASIQAAKDMLRHIRNN
ncbi:hypothetical protein BDR04DRAFT_1078301 [Suillus decipiens]|nr:hypothetical protein BDR04DRAFT_1078301 [Suillus decipiens]